MGPTYRAIRWNKSKKRYDRFLAATVFLILLVLFVLQLLFRPAITIDTMIIRATAFVAILLLHVILVIGPLCRISDWFLPLLYNRRHLGVVMFGFAFVHSVYSIIHFHAFGDTHPIISIFMANERYLEISAFPFQTLGFFALIIFLMMAVTSHDFWLKQLSPRFWKYLHMMVYWAYLLVFAHVALGTLQYEDHPIYWLMLVLGFVGIGALHLFAGFKSQPTAQQRIKKGEMAFVKVCALSEIETNYAKTVFIADQNIAVFKYNGKISAVNNICKHQMGPLGEGKVIDGCITCPWHGYQYLPENGQSRHPLKEQIATYRVKIKDDEIWVDPLPMPEGTFVEPVAIRDKEN